jgi:hypothetical protein
VGLLGRLAIILSLAAVVSAAWLFRAELFHSVRPKVERVHEILTEEDTGRPTAESLARARDKIDSLYGWSLDSIGLRRAEVASLLMAGMAERNTAYLDSVEVVGDGDRLTVRARLQLARVPPSLLGPLTGALEPWEWITLSGPLRLSAPGTGSWRIESLTLRSIQFPVETSRRLVAAALPDADGGAVRLRFPEGISQMELRADGAMVYRKEAR